MATKIIEKDISEIRIYHYINNEIKIDFNLSNVMKHLIEEAEKADLIEDYGLYMNLADAIDTRAKKETGQHLISEREWRLLISRYPI